MADDVETENEEVEKLQKAGLGKVKLLVFLLVILVLIAGTIGATLYFLGVFGSGGSGDEEAAVAEEVPSAEAAAADKPANAAKAPAMYFPIQPPFVVNFQSRGRTRYVQADVTVMTRNPKVFDAIQMHLPLIKNRLVMLFSGGVYEELQTDEGKELMRQQALEALQAIMQQEIGEKGIEQVLFTNFVMQ